MTILTCHSTDCKSGSRKTPAWATVSSVGRGRRLSASRRRHDEDLRSQHGRRRIRVLNSAFTAGSGAGSHTGPDLVMYVSTADFDPTNGNNIYFYSAFGYQGGGWASNATFEEWGALTHSVTTSGINIEKLISVDDGKTWHYEVVAGDIYTTRRRSAPRRSAPGPDRGRRSRGRRRERDGWPEDLIQGRRHEHRQRHRHQCHGHGRSRRVGASV